MEQVAVQTWPAKVLSGADTGHKIDNSDGQIHLHHHAWYIHNCNPGSGKWQSRAPAKMWSRLGCVIHFIQGGGVGTGIPNRRYGNRACGTLPRDHDTSWPRYPRDCSQSLPCTWYTSYGKASQLHQFCPGRETVCWVEISINFHFWQYIEYAKNERWKICFVPCFETSKIQIQNKYQVLHIWSGVEIWACFSAQIRFLCS